MQTRKRGNLNAPFKVHDCSPYGGFACRRDDAVRAEPATPVGLDGGAVALQPLRVQGQTGVNVAYGIAGLRLRAN